MALLNRSQLKNLFKNGTAPTEGSFDDLIESTLNKVDDGFDKSETYGESLTPEGDNNNWITFFKDEQSLQNQDPSWMMERVEADATTNQAEALSFSIPQTDAAGNMVEKSLLSISQDNAAPRIGIGTTQPSAELEVTGTLSATTIQGNYKDPKVTKKPKADGNWHDLITGLSGIHAFEITAIAAGPPAGGMYAVIVAKALVAYNYKKATIDIKTATAGNNSYQLMLQFIQSPTSSTMFHIQIKTRKPYGPSTTTNFPDIQYHITELISAPNPAV